MPPHFADDFGELGDLSIWIFGLDFAIDFFSEEEECGEGSFGRSGLD